MSGSKAGRGARWFCARKMPATRAAVDRRNRGLRLQIIANSPATTPRNEKNRNLFEKNGRFSYLICCCNVRFQNKMNKKPLPYGIKPHEIGFLILLGAALYYSGPAFWRKPWALGIFSAALLAAIPVLIYRCREEWRQLPNRCFFFTLAAAWVVLFAFLGNATFNYLDSPSLFNWMFIIDTSPMVNEGHGLLIPFVVLALFWW